MNGKTIVDKDKLNGTIETLSSLETLVNRKDLSSSFDEIECLFKEINFIHANCLNYKESIRRIYEDIEYVRRMISYLNESLKETTTTVQNIEDITSSELMELSRIYSKNPVTNDLLKQARDKSFIALQKLSGNIVNAKEMTRIPAVEQTPEEESGIDTVPIGIAIGATGILGSIGAVAVNEIYGSESRKKEVVRDVVQDEYDEEDDYSLPTKNKIVPQQTPYKASREIKEADMFYGNSTSDSFPDDFK